MEKSPQPFAVDTFKSLGDKPFFGHSTFGVIMTWIMLLCVIVAIFFVGRIIRSEDQKNQLAQLHQQTEFWTQSINNRVDNIAERLNRLVLVTQQQSLDTLGLTEIQKRARTMMDTQNEMMEIVLLDPQHRIVASFASPHTVGGLSVIVGEHYQRSETQQALAQAQKSFSTTVSEPYTLPIEGSPFLDVVLAFPYEDQTYTLVSRISLWVLLKTVTATQQDSDHFRLSLSYRNTPLITAITDSNRKILTHSALLYSLSNDLRLEVSCYAYGLLTQNVLFWVVSALGIFLVITLVGLIRFNSRQNNIEEALRAETALRKAMADSQLSGLRVTDLSGRIVYVNKTFCSMLKYDSPDELIDQMPPYSFWPKGHGTFRLMEYTDAVLQGRMQTSSFEYEPLCADGSSFHALLHITPLLSSDGLQLGWLGSLTDISEVKAAEAQLTDAHERFVRVLASMQSAVSVVDTELNQLLFSNAAYNRLFGHSVEGHKQIDAMRASKSQTGTSFVDVYFEDLDRWFAVQEKSITWTDRSTVRLQIATDITERRRNEMLLAEQAARSELNSRLVTMGEMASSLAHELNQPLAAITNYAFVMKNILKKAGVPADHELFSSMEKIDKQAERAAGIITRIRSFTKRSEPNMEFYPLKKLIDETMELATIQAQRHSAKINQFIDAEIQDIYCDAIMIEQVLLNLIKNGIEAAAALNDQTPSVTLSVYRGENQNIIFEVADNGSGISEENKKSLFDPFFTTKSTGMGMGLNICRTIVELHHGRLTISDNEPRGTIFKLALPEKKDLKNH